MNCDLNIQHFDVTAAINCLYTARKYYPTHDTHKIGNFLIWQQQAWMHSFKQKDAQIMNNTTKNPKI